MMDFDALTQGRWVEILSSFGCSPEYLKNTHGPCPLCGGRDRFRFDDKDGRGTWICNQCGAGGGVRLVAKLNAWDAKRAFAEVCRYVEGRPARKVSVPKAKQDDSQARVERVLRDSFSLDGKDPVSRYLEARSVPSAPELLCHPALTYYDADGKPSGEWPAMVGRVRNVAGEVVGLHLTYLDDGKKASVPSPKKMVGTVKGSAVRLWPMAEAVAICEGIETGLAVRALWGLPVWAALSAGGLESLELPKELRDVTICGDNDASYTGQAAAYSAAKRWTREGRTVLVRIPDGQGQDWADVRRDR